MVVLKESVPKLRRNCIKTTEFLHCSQRLSSIKLTEHGFLYLIVEKITQTQQNTEKNIVRDVKEVMFTTNQNKGVYTCFPEADITLL